MKTLYSRSRHGKPVPFLLFFSIAAFLLVLHGCTTIRPGEVGLETHYGRLQQKTYMSGRHVTGIFGRRIIKLSTRVVDYSAKEELPTREGLEISADLTLLYHLKPDSALRIYMTYGPNFEKILIVNNFIAVSREATLNYFAKDIITQRENLEKIMKAKLDSVYAPHGIVIDGLLVKDIDLPGEVLASIQEKVKNEQNLENTKLAIKRDSLQAQAEIARQRAAEQFAIEKTKDEAERMSIEANAVKDSLAAINSALTDKLINYESVQMTKGLLTSPNSKIIITDGHSPIKLNADGADRPSGGK